MFPTTYNEGADAFVSAAEHSNGELRMEVHPSQGPAGEVLRTDIASFGDSDARNVLLITSGTHGIEGFAGSGIQTTMLREGLVTSLPENLRLTMIHAVNPHGFAWRRRVNEDNVDLNRNFIDHESAHPANTGYAQIADVLSPREWNDDSRATIIGELARLTSEHGAEWLQAALSGGQYDYPDGFFYGGTALAWSNRVMARLAADVLAEADSVVMIDIHTGLGAYADAECIVEYAPNTAQHDIAESIWGSRTRSTISGDSKSAAVSGSMISGISNNIAAELVGAGLEFGTSPMPEVIQAMLADQWLHRHGQLDSDVGRQIKTEMERVFFPSSDDWRDAVLTTAREVIGQTLAYFATRD